MKLARISASAGPLWVAVTPEGYSSVAWSNGLPVAGEPTSEKGPLLAPVEPPAIIGIGLNYRRHAEETGAKLPEFPIVFNKLPRAVIGPEAPIVLPRELRSDKVDYECELGFVISRDAKNVKRANALGCTFSASPPQTT